MYLTQTNYIGGLSKKQYRALREMCSYSNVLYNVALNNIEEHYKQTQTFLRYESNYHVCKTVEAYRMLQAGVAQQTLRVIDRTFQSYFALLEKAKHGDYRFRDVQKPRKKSKDSLFPLVLQKNAITFHGSKLLVPMSRAFRKTHPFDIHIPFPERLRDKNLKEIHILPCASGLYFKVQFVYEQPVEKVQLDPENYVAIDVGVNNLAACVSNARTPYIIDGRRLKSINWHWNKEKARLQSILDKQGIKGGKRWRVISMTDKRNRRMSDVMHKAARYIVDDCLDHDIGMVIVGYTQDFKRSCNMGKRNNQNFTQIPFGDLRQYLKTLCERYGLEYVETEESYTSKSSFLDGDELPVYNPAQPYTGNFSGKRVKRGLYRTKAGLLLNADVNGAANIARKVNGSDMRPPMGLLASPQRIRLT